MTLEQIGVRATVENIGKFTSDMGRYNRAIGDAEKVTNQFAERAGKAGRALVAISAPLIALGGLSLRAAINFETAFIGVQKTVDATEEQFAELSATIREMALEIPASTTELAALGETAGQLGIRVENIAEFTRVMAALGVTTNVSSQEAATALARLVNITGLGQDQFDRLGATIVDLGNNLATTEAEILNFGLRIASAGRIAGLTEAEILGIGAALSAVGVQAQAGGTAVQRVLLGITQAVATQSEELEVFARTAGLTTQQFADLFERQAGEAFTRFVEGLAASGDDAFVILEELGLADQRLLRAFLSLAGGGDLLRESITLGTNAFAANTALMAEAERRYASVASQVSIARNRFNEMLITIGDQLVPAFVKLLDVMAPVLDFVGRMAERFPTATLVVIGLAIAVGALGLALIGISLLLPGLVVLFPALAGGITLTAIATGGLALAMSPITLTILAVSAAVIVGILIWRRYTEQVEAVIDVVLTLLKWLNPLTAALGLITEFTGLNTGVSGFGSIFADGGVQRAPGTALVGERGPELVRLPAMAQVTPTAPAGATTHFNVTANYASPQTPQSIRLDLESIRMRFGT